MAKGSAPNLINYLEEVEKASPRILNAYINQVQTFQPNDHLTKRLALEERHASQISKTFKEARLILTLHKRPIFPSPSLTITLFSLPPNSEMRW